VLTRNGVAGSGWAASGGRAVGCHPPHAGALRVLRFILGRARAEESGGGGDGGRGP